MRERESRRERETRLREMKKREREKKEKMRRKKRIGYQNLHIIEMENADEDVKESRR